MLMQLTWLYPNSSATVNIKVSNRSEQVVRLRGRSVLAQTEADAEIVMQTARSRDHILTVNLVSQSAFTFNNNTGNN